MMAKTSDIVLLGLILAIIAALIYAGEDLAKFFSKFKLPNVGKAISQWSSNVNQAVVNWNTSYTQATSYTVHGHTCPHFTVYDPALGRCVPRPMR